jgi:hypothetical protein
VLNGRLLLKDLGLNPTKTRAADGIRTRDPELGKPAPAC